MFEIKGFALLRDVPLCLASAVKALRWHIAIKTLHPDEIISSVRIRALRGRLRRGGLVQLEKRYRAITFMLVRILHIKSPCLARSCAVFEYALRMGLYTRMIIGASVEDGKFAGHAWVEVGGEPFMEAAETLASQTVMLEG